MGEKDMEKRIGGTEEMADPCRQEYTLQQVIERLSAVEKDVSDLKVGHAETKVYVKQIFEKLEDIKNMFSDMKGMFEQQSKAYADAQEKMASAQATQILSAQAQAVEQVTEAQTKNVSTWKPIVLEVLKFAGIFGAGAGALKLFGG